MIAVPLVLVMASMAYAQVSVTDSVPALLAPRTALPSEAATAGIKKFSFIVYGDTRGRHDGTEIQVEHELTIESMLGTIKRLSITPDPIRFVLQSGDAVQNGSIAAQLRVSYEPLINRLTQEGGVPYFLSVGNHDVGSGKTLDDHRRAAGLANFFAANARLIPPDGSPRASIGARASRRIGRTRCQSAILGHDARTRASLNCEQLLGQRRLADQAALPTKGS